MISKNEQRIDFSNVKIGNTFYEHMADCVYIELDGIDSYLLADRTDIKEELDQHGIMADSAEDLIANGIEIKCQIVYLPETDEYYLAAFTDNEYNETIIYDVLLSDEETSSLERFFNSDEVSCAIKCSMTGNSEMIDDSEQYSESAPDNMKMEDI